MPDSGKLQKKKNNKRRLLSRGSIYGRSAALFFCLQFAWKWADAAYLGPKFCFSPEKIESFYKWFFLRNGINFMKFSKVRRKRTSFRDFLQQPEMNLRGYYQGPEGNSKGVDRFWLILMELWSKAGQNAKKDERSVCNNYWHFTKRCGIIGK